MCDRFSILFNMDFIGTRKFPNLFKPTGYSLMRLSMHLKCSLYVCVGCVPKHDHFLICFLVKSSMKRSIMDYHSNTIEFITCILLHVGSPSIAGPGVSATYHFILTFLGLFPFLGFLITGHCKDVNYLMIVPLYAVSNVPLAPHPVGSPVSVIQLGYSHLDMLSDKIAASSSTIFTHMVAPVFPLVSAETWTTVYASVLQMDVKLSTLISSSSLVVVDSLMLKLTASISHSSHCPS